MPDTALIVRTGFPCCIEGPPAFVPKAQYALEMLLHPLGLRPHWTERAALGAGHLYYGPTPESCPAGTLALGVSPATISFFEQKKPRDPNDITNWFWEGETVPMLFTTPLVHGTHIWDDTPVPDLIASAFYWLSGWQEYTQIARDVHGRFAYAGSLQETLRTVDRPLVDIYRDMLAEVLQQAGVQLQRRTWHGHRWALALTHDVDLLREWTFGTLFRETVQYFLLNQRRVSGAARWRRLGDFVKDALRPGSDYKRGFIRLYTEAEKRDATATFFLKTGAHAPEDQAYSYKNGFIKTQIQTLKNKGFEIGLHPSYHAHNHPAYLAEEHARLRAVTDADITTVRQHYLRWEAALTPHLHETEGFLYDSTLGFADYEGFRHGTCQPFRWFDLRQNKPLNLWEIPLTFMDGTLFNRRAMTPERAFTKTRHLMRTCQRFGGICVGLWHNIAYDDFHAPGWGQHFEDTMDWALANGAFVGSLRDAMTGWQNKELAA